MIGMTIFILIFTLFIFTPLTIYQGWLLYKHVQATQLMWFLFWFNSTCSIFLQLILKIIEIVSKKKEEK